MFASSRRALESARAVLLNQLGEDSHLVAAGAKVGADLFAVVELLERERSLRIALADDSLPETQRRGIAQQVFGDKVGEESLAVVLAAVAETWSAPRDLRDGLVSLGREALLRSAQAQGQLETVEEELFRISRVFIDQPELEQRLNPRYGTPEARSALLSQVLYGKVTAVTEALVAQAIARPEQLPADDVEALSAQAAQVRGRGVARVTSASELSEAQKRSLEERLTALYHRELTVHHEVDPSILGGVVIRVGDEIIDGSTAGRLSGLRAKLG